MTASLSRTWTALQPNRISERWFFSGAAIAMLLVSIAGFAPAILHPAGRRGPLSLLAALHGIGLFAWLCLFALQSLLVANGRVALHRQIGRAAAFMLLFIIPVSYAATVEMVRRGFDLSGDQYIEPHPRPGFLDPLTGSVFNFISLLLFTALTMAALWYRRRPAIHKRLMLFANIEVASASFVHLWGHLHMLTGWSVSASLGFFCAAAIAGDYLTEKRVRPLTAMLAIGLLVAVPLEATLLGPSAAWHSFVTWLIQ